MKCTVALHIYRVVVRGVFDDLGADDRTRLAEHAGEHDIFDSAYTADGTLTYDHHLHAFNTRFELRADGDPAEAQEEVRVTALARTEQLLARHAVRGRDLRVTVTDMADMWGAASRRDRVQRGRR